MLKRAATMCLLAASNLCAGQEYGYANPLYRAAFYPQTIVQENFYPNATVPRDVLRRAWVRITYTADVADTHGSVTVHANAGEKAYFFYQFNCTGKTVGIMDWYAGENSAPWKHMHMGYRDIDWGRNTPQLLAVSKGWPLTMCVAMGRRIPQRQRRMIYGSAAFRSR